MKEILSTNHAPGAIGPYSQGIKNGNIIFVSGQLPMNPHTGELFTDVKKAAAAALDNVKAILSSGGATLDDVVKVVVYLTDMNDFADVNEVYGTYFTQNCPARSCFAVAGLPKGAVLEIEAIAVV
jgi:2-iminobutanoate/2-iminopropanoate deaminase